MEDIGEFEFKAWTIFNDIYKTRYLQQFHINSSWIAEHCQYDNDVDDDHNDYAGDKDTWKGMQNIANMMSARARLAM